MLYRATVVQGRQVPKIVELDATSVLDAHQQFSRMGATVLSCSSVGIDMGRLWSGSRAPAGRRHSGNTVILVEQLRDLLTAGLSVIEALDALRRSTRDASADLMARLEASLKAGNTLSNALASEPAFPPLLVALVRSAELTSDLPQTLARFLEHERRVSDLRHKLVSVSIYPALLVVVGGLVLGFLLLYVMPRFARIFEGMAGELPWSAQLMVGWSHALNDHGGTILLIAGAMIVSVFLILSSGNLRTKIADALLTRLPLGRHVKSYFLARWYRATGMLVTGGIPFPEALAISNDLLPMSLQAAGRKVERGVREGLTPSEAHVRAGMATPVAEQLTIAGERTGDLGTVLTRIAQFHEAEVGRTLERAMRAIEPVAMVLIGLCVGLVVVLMYMPIFELASAIQ